MYQKMRIWFKKELRMRARVKKDNSIWVTRINVLRLDID